MPIVDTFPLAFPGRAVKAGAGDPEVVLAIQRRLNAAGCGPVAESGRFGEPTTVAVKRFQMRFTDLDGLPLKVDGVVGPITWAALFGASDALVEARVEAEDPLLKGALERAAEEIGVLEAPPGSNRGPRVDTYLKAVGLDPGAGSFAWCAAFVYFCFNEASQTGGRRNPLVKTAGVLEHWNKAEQRGARRIKATEAMARPELIKPGQIFVMDFGRGAGHTGVVRGLRDGKLVTIEGNTNDGGSREGIGVFERTGRTLGSINKGFLDYSDA